VRTPAIVHVMGWRSQQYGSFERFLVASAARCAEHGARTHLVFSAPPASSAFGEEVPAELHILPSPRHSADSRFADHARDAPASHRRHPPARRLWRGSRCLPRRRGRHGPARAVPLRNEAHHPRARRAATSSGRDTAGSPRVSGPSLPSRTKSAKPSSRSVPATKAELCYLDVDPAAYRGKEAERSRVRRELGVPDGSRVILTTSHLRPSKGVELLPALTAKLLDAGKDVIVLVAGDGIAAGATRGPGERARCRRTTPPARRSRGRPAPTRVTEVSDLSTLLAGAAMLVPPGDVGALAAGCRRLLGDATPASSLRNRGLELVSNRLNVARATEQHCPALPRLRLSRTPAGTAL
jgi:hypothetical protein